MKMSSVESSAQNIGGSNVYSPKQNVKIRADKRNCRETDKVGN